MKSRQKYGVFLWIWSKIKYSSGSVFQKVLPKLEKMNFRKEYSFYNNIASNSIFKWLCTTCSAAKIGKLTTFRKEKACTKITQVIDFCINFRSIKHSRTQDFAIYPTSSAHTSILTATAIEVSFFNNSCHSFLFIN